MTNSMTSSMTTTHTLAQRPVSILICALGGEGGGVLADWLAEAAQQAGFAAQATSIPGVAQRTGATTYFFEVLPVPMVELGGRRPVFSLNPIPGALDAVISSELLESARCASNGLPSPDRTLFITSSSRTLTTNERSKLGDGRLDDAALLSLVQSVSRAHHVLDMQRIAQDQGTVVSAVMFGALAGSGLLPFDKAACIAVIQQGGRGAQASLAGFEAAWQIVAKAREHSELAAQMINEALQAQAPAPAPELAGFPAQTLDILSLGHARVREYQDRDYGQLYLSRLRQVLDAEHRTDPEHLQSHAVTCEMARWLALWMAFDDIVRVADLKSRVTRSIRVRREAKAGDKDVLAIYDHFKPGIAEIAGLLPQPLAERLLDWDRQRVAEGRETWAMPVKLASHTVLGMLLLRVLAAAKIVRRFGSRYAQEQQLMSEWLQAVLDGLKEDWQLGHELAQCGRLIKGYGSTNERGRNNLLHVIRHLADPAMGTAAFRSAAIRRAREAALSDEAGTQLDRVLAEAGAPARPLKAQPIRWMRRTTAAAATASTTPTESRS